MGWIRRGGNKFGAKRTQLDGRSFSSGLEADTYLMLKLREKAGEIEILQCQKHVHLTDARILYIADFFVLEKATGKEYFVEAKGFSTPEWMIKKRLWAHYGPADLEIWMRRGKGVFLVETVRVKE